MAANNDLRYPSFDEVSGAMDELEDSLEDDNRLVNFVFHGDSVLEIILSKTHFDGLEPEQLNEHIMSLASEASKALKTESERLQELPETKDLETPRNNGALYDDVIFDVGIYLDPKSQEGFNLKPTFGALAHDHLIHENYLELSEQLENISRIGMNAPSE